MGEIPLEQYSYIKKKLIKRHRPSRGRRILRQEGRRVTFPKVDRHDKTFLQEIFKLHFTKVSRYENIRYDLVARRFSYIHRCNIIPWELITLNFR